MCWSDFSAGEAAEADANLALSQNPTLATISAVAPFLVPFLPDLTATASIFWSGPGTEAAAQAWAASTGGQTLGLAADATLAEAQAASASFAASATGNVVVFQSATTGVAIDSVWAGTEFPTLIANPKVTSTTYHVIDETGNIIWSLLAPK